MARKGLAGSVPVARWRDWRLAGRGSGRGDQAVSANAAPGDASANAAPTPRPRLKSPKGEVLSFATGRTIGRRHPPIPPGTIEWRSRAGPSVRPFRALDQRRSHANSSIARSSHDRPDLATGQEEPLMWQSRPRY